MSKSILDLMPKEEAEKAVARGRKRLDRQRARKGLDVSPEVYLIAEFGYYFGWEGIRDLRRGYTISEDLDEDGNLVYVKSVLELSEAQVILEGARKVWYTKLIEQSHGSLVANSSAYSKNPGQAFNSGVQDFIERAEVKN